MAEYIEREAVLKHLRECEGTPPEIGYTYPIFKALECFVEDVPAADVAPVVHGRWVNGVIEREPVIKSGRVYRNDTPTFKCSECKETFAGITYGFNYCPNCGARMDGDN